MRQKWKKVKCRKCGKYLAEVRIGTEVFCSKCNIWIKVEKGGETT